MKNTQIASDIVNAQAQIIIDALNNGYLNIYNSIQPANANTPISTQQLLVSLVLSSPSAPAPVNGLITFTPPAVAIASGSGAATWFRLFQSDGVTAVMDGSVALAGANLNLSSVTVVAGARVQIAEFTHNVIPSSSV